jgi:Na+(H+)/acetate symporter ActP
VREGSSCARFGCFSSSLTPGCFGFRSTTSGCRTCSGSPFFIGINWFLIGGDVYTAYTMIAVPALVYAVGAYGFFALPYAIIVYPFVFAVMPVLWTVAKAHYHVTAADVVHGRYASRPLELAVALTGVLATMPYIALQLIGMETTLHALGLKGEIPLAAAFSFSRSTIIRPASGRRRSSHLSRIP